MGPIVPILRIFDVPKAMEFYRDFLGFTVDWGVRSEPEAPLYTQLSHGLASIHLSAHFGDAAPGTHVRIEVAHVADYHAALLAKAYPYARPALETRPWGEHAMTIPDPFGNRITFYERLEPATPA